MHPTRSLKALALAAALALPSGSLAADGGKPTRETPIVVRIDEAGFAWTDAGIGAVAGIGATLVAAGGLALVRPQRASSSLDEKGGRP